MPRSTIDDGRGRIPWWGWMYAIACFVIPLAPVAAPLGFIFPAVIGGSGGVTCLNISRATQKSPELRMLFNMCVVAASWSMLFILLAVKARGVGGN